MKQPRFDSVNARVFAADAFAESLRSKNAYGASVLGFEAGGAFGAAR
jgi:hypothetical protein